MGKTGNGNMAQSEESMTLMTSYRFPHYDALPSAVILTNILYIKLFFYNIYRDPDKQAVQAIFRKRP